MQPIVQKCHCFFKILTHYIVYVCITPYFFLTPSLLMQHCKFPCCGIKNDLILCLINDLKHALLKYVPKTNIAVLYSCLCKSLLTQFLTLLCQSEDQHCHLVVPVIMSLILHKTTSEQTNWRIRKHSVRVNTVI